MTYADTAALSQDPGFAARLGAALATEAAGRSDPLSDLLLSSAGGGAQFFMPLVAAAPGFDQLYAAGGQDAITDGDLLAAVQASWARVAAIYPPP